LAAHHVVNLVLDGDPYVLTLCDACVGGGLYDARVGGARHRFRVDGRYSGTPYVIDDVGGSAWTMATMKPLSGPALDHGPLRRLPMVHATWAEWRRRHPDTLIVDDPGEPDDGHGADQRSPGHVVLPDFADGRLTPVDDRLDQLALVLGVEVDGEARSYPLDALAAHGGIVNDVVGAAPIVVLSVPDSYTAIAFHRTVSEEVLTFSWNPSAVDGAPTIVGGETTWDLFGSAIDGRLTGAHLRYVWGGIQKWFNWSNLAPGSPIWSPR
jgi:hypothetical protein